MVIDATVLALTAKKSSTESGQMSKVIDSPFMRRLFVKTRLFVKGLVARPKNSHMLLQRILIWW